MGDAGFLLVGGKLDFLLPTRMPHSNMGVALSRVICWSILHTVAGGDLAKQLGNPWGHGEGIFFHFNSRWWQVGVI